MCLDSVGYWQLMVVDCKIANRLFCPYKTTIILLNDVYISIVVAPTSGPYSIPVDSVIMDFNR